MPSYIPAWRYGGPIHSVHGLCKALAARGHSVSVATTNVDGDTDSVVPVNAPVDLDGVEVHYFRSRFLRRLYFSPPMYRFIEQMIPGCDIVHAHSVFLWPTTAAAHLARKYRKPLVLSPRGMLVKDLIARRNTFLKRSWIRLFERKNVACAAAVHVTSSLEARELLALGLNPGRLLEIPNGVEWSQPLEPAPRTHDLPNRYVLFLGRISWKKGLDRLIASMAFAPDATLVVAGNDDEALWPTLAKIAGDLSISHRVRYIGFVEGQQKQRVLAEAAALALPSYSENFGNVVLEAMACGVPVVVTPEVGLASFVEETRSGIVAPGDPEQFGLALASLIKDEAFRSRLGENARKASLHYSWDTIAARMESEYFSLLPQALLRDG